MAAAGTPLRLIQVGVAGYGRTWLETVFMPQCQNRGAAVIKARGSSSALSAANGALDHVKSMVTPTPANAAWS